MKTAPSSSGFEAAMEKLALSIGDKDSDSELVVYARTIQNFPRNPGCAAELYLIAEVLEDKLSGSHQKKNS